MCSFFSMQFLQHHVLIQVTLSGVSFLQQSKISFEVLTPKNGLNDKLLTTQDSHHIQRCKHRIQGSKKVDLALCLYTRVNLITWCWVVMLVLDAIALTGVGPWIYFKQRVIMAETQSMEANGTAWLILALFCWDTVPHGPPFSLVSYLL